MLENSKFSVTQIRRSSADITLGLALVTIALHVSLRPTTWRYEWLRVFDSFHLVTLLICPIFAGVAAWNGISCARTRQFLFTTRREYRAVGAGIAASASSAFASYLLGLTLVAAYAIVRGIAGVPTMRDILTTAPALSLVLFSVAFGFTAGWRTRSPYVVPLAAIGFFLALMLSFELPGVFVEVGGATGTLVGLQPKTHLQITQTALFLSLSLLFLGCCLSGQIIRTRAIRNVMGAALLVTAATVATIGASGGLRFEPAEIELQCQTQQLAGKPFADQTTSGAISVCLHPSYENFREIIALELQEPLRRIAETGLVATPTKITMDPTDASAGATYLDPLTFQFGDSYAAVNLMMSNLIPDHCDVFASEELTQAYTGLVFWLHASSGEPADLDDPSIPAELTGLDTPEARRWVVLHTARLAACG